MRQVIIGAGEWVRCKARVLRKPEAYMMTYGEDFLNASGSKFLSATKSALDARLD
jgi:hypothetical protein